MATMPQAQSESSPKKKRKSPIRREGERFRVALTNADGEKLSFSVSPSDSGYTLRGRIRSTEGKTRMAIEQFSETVHGDSFVASKNRAQELAAAAIKKGWTQQKTSRKIEDLF